jgi:hypothetical protein
MITQAGKQRLHECRGTLARGRGGLVRPVARSNRHAHHRGLGPTQRIQETHILIGHVLCELVDEHFGDEA